MSQASRSWAATVSKTLSAMAESSIFGGVLFFDATIFFRILNIPSLRGLACTRVMIAIVVENIKREGERAPQLLNRSLLSSLLVANSHNSDNTKLGRFEQLLSIVRLLP